MRSVLLAAALTAAPAALLAAPPAKKPAQPAAKAPAKPKPAPKPMAFAATEFDLAPGETYPTELFIPSPTGKAISGRLRYLPSPGLIVIPDARWTGKLPPWGAKTFPKIAARADASGELTVKCVFDKGGEAVLPVRVVEPLVEPLPGLRQLTVKITNPFRKRTLHGRVTAANPDRFLQKVTALEFKIPPGETGEVVFPLPGAAPAEGETYDFTLSFESYQGWRFRQTYPLAFPPHT